MLERWIPTNPLNLMTNSENTVVNSNPVELENQRLLTPATNDRFPAVRILLIGDDPDFRLIASETLRAAAFFVDEATNGTQALEKIKQQLPDIVILDSVMEGINGFQTCRLLRTDPAMADVPIIMSTARGDSDSINKAFAAGATDFIVKPINYQTSYPSLVFYFKSLSEYCRTQKLQTSADDVNCAKSGSTHSPLWLLDLVYKK